MSWTSMFKWATFREILLPSSDLLERLIIFPFGSDLCWIVLEIPFRISDKVCMVLCINCIICFLWCCFWPPSTETVLDSFCVVSTVVFWGDNFDGGYGSNTEVICDNAEWSFFIDSISFFRISVSFCNVSFLFFSVCFAADTSEGVFLLVLWLRGALKIDLLNVIVLFVICKILFAEFKSQICVASSF